MNPIRRRHLLICTGAVLAGPAGRAQESGKAYRVGWLSSGLPPAGSIPNVSLEAFMQRMRELGYVEGRNLLVEQRYGEGRPERLAEHAQQLVRIPVDVILANSTTATAAASQATRTIPIVMGSAANPLAARLIASLARPGGNVTGLTLETADTTAKRLELLKEAVPGVRRVAALYPATLQSAAVVSEWLKASAAAARKVGVALSPLDLPIDNPAGWDEVFRRAAADGVDAATVMETPTYLSYRARLAELALRHRVRHLSVSRTSRGGRPHGLWRRRSGSVSPSRAFRRPDPQGGQARGSSGRAADEVHVHRESQDRQGAGHHDAEIDPAAGGPADRMTVPVYSRRRRRFLLGATALLCPPLPSLAEQPGRVHVIGFLGATSAAAYVRELEWIRAGLRKRGYVEGGNLVIEARWAEGSGSRLREIAAELVALKVDAIVTHALPGTVAAAAETRTIPIVMADGPDPVAAGLAISLARPGGNVTGSFSFVFDEIGKRLQLLTEVVPRFGRAAFLASSADIIIAEKRKALQSAAVSLNLEVHQFLVRESADLAEAFNVMVKAKMDGILVNNEPFLNSQAGAIAALAMAKGLPSVGYASFADAGGLLAYGANRPALYGRVGYFIDRIFKGANPGEIPFERAAKFDMIVNLKTARALAIEIPRLVLLRADRTIE